MLSSLKFLATLASMTALRFDSKTEPGVASHQVSLGTLSRVPVYLSLSTVTHSILSLFLSLFLVRMHC